jgi:uncharacterized protein (DUF1015 family)
MATLRPFRALAPSPERAAFVAAVPYDVVSTDEARALAAGSPLSFLHVSRAEIDLPERTPPYADAVYERAAANFEKLKREAPLMVDEVPRLYVYRLRREGREQTGVAGVCSIDEYDQDTIRKHERTRPEKEDDRTRHMVTLRAQTGPVLLTYRDRPDIDQAVERAKQAPPLYDFTAPDGVAHTLWRLDPETSHRLSEQFRSVPLFYIADGHHRAASASRARQEMRRRFPAAAGEQPYDFLLGVLFPARQLAILPYNRVVKDLGGRSEQDFLSSLREKVSVSETAAPSPARRGEVSLYLGGRWYGLGLPSFSSGDATASLDAELLQRHVLDPILGIRDVRTDKRIDFVGGIRGTKELEKLVDSGRFAAAFSMFPVSTDELIAVSDANQIMPPKSTWFEPKLRDGLLIHVI